MNQITVVASSFQFLIQDSILLNFSPIFYLDASDIHFIVSNNGLAGSALSKNGFGYLWAGAKANKGAKGGKLGYEVKVSENQLRMLNNSIVTFLFNTFCLFRNYSSIF